MGGGYLFSFLWGVSVGVILEHIGETLVDILVDGSRGFSGVLESLTRAPCSHHCTRSFRFQGRCYYLADYCQRGGRGGPARMHPVKQFISKCQLLQKVHLFTVGSAVLRRTHMVFSPARRRRCWMVRDLATGSPSWLFQRLSPLL